MTASGHQAEILLLEDSALDAELIGEHLRRGGVAHRTVRTWTRADFSGALDRQRFDVIIADYVLPSFDGLAALEIASAKVPDTPFIFVSGTLDEETAIEALKKGAVDFVTKQRLNRLPSAVMRAFAEAEEKMARMTAEEALRALNETLETRVEEEIARRGKAEEQLRQAQKMESIGHLTGGVAHDFNNLLTVVIGNLESLRRHAGDWSPERAKEAIDNAMLGAQRAATLTQRLLAFSRRQPLDPKQIDVNALVGGMSDLFGRTLGEHVELQTVLAGGLWRTHADPNQLENAILNLAVNARDAMTGGGKLTIETSNTYLDEAYCEQHVDVAPGQYVVICVTDTGPGMNEEVLAQAFEPFFTTKGIGEGTGLGLSQVYGFVKQSGGHVKIYSEPGVGTTVKIYLPRLLAVEEEAGTVDRAEATPPGTAHGTVLVVEDDEGVRRHATEIVGELGYRVLEASDGPAALRILDRHPDVRLLFTDVGLPNGMNGRQLAEEACRRHPRLKVLFATGYARNAIVHGGRLDPGVQLVTKPYTFATLAARMRKILEADGGSPRILVVEDEPLVRMIAVDTLEAAGYLVEEAGSATEALARMRNVDGGIDAAVVDIGLPDRKGDALAAEMRAMRSDLPIVIASGYDSAEIRQRFDGDSLIGFVGKPYDSDGLVGTLRKLGLPAR